MTELDTLTLRSIAESAQSVARLLDMGDAVAAKAALDRAEHRLLIFSADKPPHARAVRLARETVERARRAYAAFGSKTQTARQQGAERRATVRAVARARV